MNPFIVRLERTDRLSEVEREAIAKLPTTVRDVAAGQDIVREGDRPTHSTLVLSGFAGRYNTVRDGARQISAVHLAGDFVDLHSLLLHTMDHGVAALTRCSIAQCPHEALVRVTEQLPHLTRLLWLSTLIDAAIHRRWLVAMGRQPAVAQLAHLVCELHVRLGVVGETDGDSFDLPLSQSELGDVLGLSLVHVNRVVQELKRSGLIAWRGKRVDILDLPGLRRLAEFDPTYLHLDQEPR